MTSQGTYDIPILNMIWYSSILIVPLVIFIWMDLKLYKDLFISIVRMVLQLFLIGLFLKYLFLYDNIWLNLLWVLIMIFAANFTILKNSGMLNKRIYLTTIPVYIVIILLVFLTFFIPLGFNNVRSAQYMIPLIGMILGNILSSNIIGLQRFYEDLIHHEDDYIQYILAGAGFMEAIKPFARQALKTAILPKLGIMATMGLVSIPGMMTGQILGGVPPISAIKYQIIIMIGIIASATLSVICSIIVSALLNFDSYGRICKDVRDLL
ncbi:MAG: ABC transporter permease [Candidatus Marinimicrobia bacterium]|nr:ABC transporter permease [Candidatus Neomarinimicrobiota bacterium]